MGKVMIDTDTINDWHQVFVYHCPKRGCDGMLMSSDFCHEMKCSQCGRLWYEKTEWVEVKKE